MAWNESNGNGNGKDKDPWGKRKQAEGPPDLDEALKNLWRKLGLAGKGGQGADGDASGSGFAGFIIFAFILLIIWALSGIFIVSPAEEAVVLRLGRYIKTVGPGPHWIPRFIDNKTIVNVKNVYNFSYGAPMLTSDENIVSVSTAVQYRIANPNDFLFRVVDPQKSLQEATASALRQVIGHTKLDDILTVGRAVVRGQVEEQIIKILALYDTGIEITDVAMQPATAPEEVKAAFDDAIRAQEDEQRFINQAEAYAMGVLPQAEGQAKRILEEAKAYREETVLDAEGRAKRFTAVLPEYLRAPKVTRERLYLDMMQSVLSKTSKVLVDLQGGNNVLYLPLDKIIEHHRNGIAAKAFDENEDNNNGSSSTNENTKASNNARWISSNQTARDDYIRVTRGRRDQ